MARAGRVLGLLLAAAGLLSTGTALGVAAPHDDVGATATGVDEVAITVQLIRSLAETQAGEVLTAPESTPGRFVRPAAGAITGPFGERRRGHRHPGVDFDGETGAPVWAAAAGRVVAAGWAPSGYRGYGRVVIIDHGAGIETVYAHLSRVRVVVGQRVRPGSILGAIGTTGHSTGSHLHFEVRRDGAVTNPMAWLRAPASRS